MKASLKTSKANCCCRPLLEICLAQCVSQANVTPPFSTIKCVIGLGLCYWTCGKSVLISTIAINTTDLLQVFFFWLNVLYVVMWLSVWFNFSSPCNISRRHLHKTNVGWLEQKGIYSKHKCKNSLCKGFEIQWSDWYVTSVLYQYIKGITCLFLFLNASWIKKIKEKKEKKKKKDGNTIHCAPPVRFLALVAISRETAIQDSRCLDW